MCALVFYNLCLIVEIQHGCSIKSLVNAQFQYSWGINWISMPGLGSQYETQRW